MDQVVDLMKTHESTGKIWDILCALERSCLRCSQAEKNLFGNFVKMFLRGVVWLVMDGLNNNYCQKCSIIEKQMLAYNLTLI